MFKLTFRKLYHAVVPHVIAKTVANSRQQLTNFKILAAGYGQYASIKQWSCVDANNKPIPWYTYPALEYLRHLDLTETNVFEYGSGNSTCWWALRVKAITSVEDDAEWFERVKTTIFKTDQNNVQYFFETEKYRYVNRLSKNTDIVVIDGNFRQECAQHILNDKNHFGAAMLVFDNSDWYPVTIKKLRESLGWLEVDFHGFGPINAYTWTTTIFIHPNRINMLKFSENLGSLYGTKVNAETE